MTIGFAIKKIKFFIVQNVAYHCMFTNLKDA